MRSFKAKAMLAALLALACMGCGGGEQEYVGHWQRTNSGSTVQQQVGEAPVTLDIRADNTFTLTKLTADSTGTWEATDDGIELTYVTRAYVIGTAEGVTMHFGDDDDTLVTEANPVSGWKDSFARK